MDGHCTAKVGRGTRAEGRWHQQELRHASPRPPVDTCQDQTLLSTRDGPERTIPWTGTRRGSQHAKTGGEKERLCSARQQTASRRARKGGVAARSQPPRSRCSPSPHPTGTGTRPAPTFGRDGGCSGPARQRSTRSWPPGKPRHRRVSPVSPGHRIAMAKSGYES
eukprot:565977-Rhodomonas_salina.1